MAKVLYFILVTSVVTLSIVAQQTNRNGSVSVGASLTATDDIMPWLSPSGDFAFGFKRIQGKDNLYVLSIWYDKIPDKTIIWYPETNAMVSRGSKVDLLDGRGLVLSDPLGREVWNSGSISNLAYGVMNDTGNFVLIGRNSSKIWESFNFPRDTLLPTQVMVRGIGSMNLKMSETNFSNGRFQLCLLPDGNLVLNTVDMFSSYPLDAYYISGTYDPSNSTNSGEQLIFDATGYMYILRRNGQRSDLTPREAIPSGDYYHRATLDPDGVFTQYYYPKNPTGNTNWETIWFKPDNMCNRLSDSVGSGACGLNSVCSLENNRPKCECPQGFSLVDSNDPNGDCNPNFTPSCDAGYRVDLFDFTELFDFDWPQSDYAHINPTDEQSCKRSCLEDCFCVVATYKGSQCWKKTLPLFNGKKDSSLNVKAFLKFQKGNVSSPHSPPRFPGEKNDKTSSIFAGPVLLSISVSLIVFLIGVICVGLLLIYKKKSRNYQTSSKAFMTNVPHFTYKELVKATNRFRDELGKGAFGTVYQGMIGTDMVAVKKLDLVIQDGEKEFQAEVNAIARTHHKNLVQLLGYCHDGEQRLLVYECMSNGTLASFLFGEERPSWKQRSHIALGIAKGLSYLHEECSTQVIHCDIKPQNILLDDYYNAKISDFGLAKLLMMNQSRTNTGIRGTKGYVAPEWFRNAPVTTKIDVYSYGVLLLEIISCRKSVKENENGDDYGAILTDFAWDCYEEGILDAFVENDSEALDDHKNLRTSVMVGLWCVQENPSLRPTMRKVIQMLEGVIEVSEPSCPFPFTVTSS